MDLKPREIILIFIFAMAASVLVPGLVTKYTTQKQDIRYTLGD